MGSDAHQAMCYPPEDQYEEWKARADEMDMTVSEWMQAMIEAGRKQFDFDVEPDATNQKLRKQRDDLRRELQKARQLIERLKTQLHRTEREKIASHIEENPGVAFGDIVQEIIDTAPERTNLHLDALEGDRVRKRSDGYYPVREGETDG